MVVLFGQEREEIQVYTSMERDGALAEVVSYLAQLTPLPSRPLAAAVQTAEGVADWCLDQSDAAACARSSQRAGRGHDAVLVAASRRTWRARGTPGGAHERLIGRLERQAAGGERQRDEGADHEFGHGVHFPIWHSRRVDSALVDHNPASPGCPSRGPAPMSRVTPP